MNVPRCTYAQPQIASIGLTEAQARENGMSYSQLIAGLKKAEIEVDRRVLADLAVHDKPAFNAVVDQAKASLAA